VGVTAALHSFRKYILPMHALMGVFTSRSLIFPIHRLFHHGKVKLGGFTKGRDREFHFWYSRI